jgi:CheY-like chemotaxis protein
VKEAAMPDPIILYVEDDFLSREVMQALLIRLMGLRNLTIFEDSTDFIQNMETLAVQPDVIFLDIHMEPVDGFAMLRQIRKNEALRATKVVALTASVMNEEVKMLRDAGFNGVIAKPLDADTFPKTLERILNGEPVWNIK